MYDILSYHVTIKIKFVGLGMMMFSPFIIIIKFKLFKIRTSFREAFEVFDANGDGEIDAGELISILTQVGIIECSSS